jgi:hypothetical protein
MQNSEMFLQFLSPQVENYPITTRQQHSFVNLFKFIGDEKHNSNCVHRF